MNPTVSVIIASRNYGRYLATAVRSVFAQTWTDLEVIIIDDGSTDDTPTVVRSFADESRVRVFRTDGLGQSRAKNLGIMHSRGTYLAFLDGDDEWLPTKLERQLALFADPQVGVVYARRVLMNAEGTEQPTTQPPLMVGAIYNDLLTRNTICFSSVVVRRDVLETVGLFHPQQALAIDYDLWLRIAQHYHFAAVDDVLVRYRTGHANLSKRITERLHTVLSILRRSLVRRGHQQETPLAIQDQSWGETFRVMAYVHRDRSWWQAICWYWRAAWYDHQWLSSLKSIGGTLYHGLRHRGR